MIGLLLILLAITFMLLMVSLLGAGNAMEHRANGSYVGALVSGVGVAILGCVIVYNSFIAWHVWSLM